MTTTEVRMTKMYIVLLTLNTLHLVLSCENIVLRLKLEPHAGFLCSPWTTQVNGPWDLYNLLQGENVAGIYRRHQKAVQVCYWKELPGLVSQASLSGGDMYTSGE